MTTAAMLAIWLSAATPISEGERLSYALGCVRCHHQTPADGRRVPSLVTVRRYSAEQFHALLRQGKTRTGRDLVAAGRLMGITAVEQYKYLTDAEIDAVYGFLSSEWNGDRAQAEQDKIPSLYKQDQ